MELLRPFDGDFSIEVEVEVAAARCGVRAFIRSSVGLRLTARLLSLQTLGPL